MVAKPPTMSVNNSERVIFSRYGRTNNGASTIPTKISAETERDSAPLILIVFAMIHAMIRTIHCMTPRWYSTAISDEKNTLVIRVWKTKK